MDDAIKNLIERVEVIEGHQKETERAEEAVVKLFQLMYDRIKDLENNRGLGLNLQLVIAIGLLVNLVVLLVCLFS